MKNIFRSGTELRGNSYRIVATAVVLLIALAAGLFFYLSSRSKTKVIVEETREDLIDQKYQKKKLEIEQLFTLAYQSIRTIGLLPSVRAIKGENRRSDGEDVVAQGRFSREGHQTVQQLYNNLATNVNVSEIYAVLDGFFEGQVPFFMYDSLIIGESSGGNEEHTMRNTDYPEESEDEEYSYYPRQLSYFRSHYPVLAVTDLDDIPVVSSPPMRTCDNSQYISRSEGDPLNAFGILYSVPFYDYTKNFRGIISAVVRLNVLEAALMDVPFIVVTDADREASRKAGYTMPGKNGNFLLVNKEFGTYIGDRRNGELLTLVKDMLDTDIQSEDIYVQELSVKDKSPWLLFYRYDEDVLMQAVQHEKSLLTLKLAALAVITGMALLAMHLNYRKKKELGGVATVMRDIAEREGDLTSRLKGSWKGEVGDLVRWVNFFIGKMHDMVSSIKKAGSGVSSANQKMVSSAEMISHKMASQKDRSAQVAAAATEMSQTVADIARSTSGIASSAADTLNLAERGGTVVRDSVEEVTKIREAVLELSELISSLRQNSQNIGDIVNVINDIAEQTNLLALNAAIEAARAGEQGRGFAVVADEVRKLAEKTSLSTKEISEVIKTVQHQTTSAGTAMEESLKRVQSGVDLSRLAGESLNEIVNGVTSLQAMIQTIAASSEEMSSAAERVSSDMEDIARTSDDTNNLVYQMSESIQELALREGNLSQEISFFKTDDAGTKEDSPPRETSRQAKDARKQAV